MSATVGAPAALSELGDGRDNSPMLPDPLGWQNAANHWAREAARLRTRNLELQRAINNEVEDRRKAVRERDTALRLVAELNQTAGARGVGCIHLPLPSALIEWIIRRAQRTPFWHLPGYMNRWWMFGAFRDSNHQPVPKRWWQRVIDCAGRVHQIMRSDNDRALHDHPWSYLTVILKGGYWEITDDGRRWYGPGSVLWRPYGSRHRLELPEGCDCWSLFVTFKKRGSWGFYTRNGWVQHNDYVDGQS